MWSRRRFLATFGLVALAGCSGGGGSGDVVYVGDPWDDPWDDPFDDDAWIYYYDEDDGDFLVGLTDEERDALKKRWNALSPEEKQQIRDRWNGLSADERARTRAAWGSLDAQQRQQVVSSMQTRARSGTLRPVTPLQADPSRLQARPRAGTARSGAGVRTGSRSRGSVVARRNVRIGGGRGGRR